MTMLISPLLSAVLFASVFHVLVMWRFESFLGLGPLIFMVVFGYCYLFPDLRHMLNRMIGLAFFFIIASITNEQSYSFLRVAGASLGMSLAVVVLIVTAYVPHLPLAEQAFMRLSRRFFRSCAWLVSDLSSEAARGETRPMRWQRAYHLREVTTLPRKLAVWGMFINPKALPGTTPAQVTAVVSTVQGLMGRLQELREARGRTDALALSNELQRWRHELEAVFHRLAERPDAIDADTLRASLDDFLVRLETRIKEVVVHPDTGEANAADGEDFYRLLGAHRSVSEALVDYARAAGAIGWSPWREERFA